MARISADVRLCQGYGNCADEAPDFFDVDDDGLVVVLREEVGEADYPVVDAAVRSCPVAALAIHPE